MKVAKGTPVLGPVMLSIATVLAAWNWYLKPERAVAWGASMIPLVLMMLALGVASRRLRHDEAGQASRQIQGAAVFGGLMMTLALAVKLAHAYGLWGGDDFARRGMMVILGVFFAFTGNAMPKTLTPLSALQCDPAKIQAFQRLAGWTWVLTGLGYSMAWLLLPIDAAQPTSLVLLVGGMLVVAAQVVRLRRSRHKAA